MVKKEKEIKVEELTDKIKKNSGLSLRVPGAHGCRDIGASFAASDTLSASIPLLKTPFKDRAQKRRP